MNEGSDDGMPSLHALDAKIERVTSELKPKPPVDITDGSQGKSMAFAMRLAAEFISGVIVGTGAGFFLDKWLGTSPFILIIGFLLGFAAGLKTMLRTLEMADKRL